MITLRSSTLALSACASLLIGVAACGGSDASVFTGGDSEDPGHDGNAGGGPMADQTGPTSAFDACVASTASAALQPVNLIMMFDKSGSMGDTTNKPTPFDPNLKWVPVTTGMKAFLSDPSSVGVNAALQFFPEGGDIAGVCGYAYGTPKVPLTSLANASAFLAAIDAESPSGGTPTLPALRGALAYAKQAVTTRPTEKSVVVLITDGEPGMMVNGSFGDGCPDNDIPHVQAEAAAAFKGSPSISTYVIGVGPALEKLDAVAAAGGTGKAIMVSVTSPAQTKGIFQGALDSIRQQTMSCDFAVPAAPDGKQIDTNAVNVVYRGSSGKEAVLTYSKDCTVAGGWHYDNVSAPTRIELCPASCGEAQSDRAGKLTLAFGCVTKTAIK